MVVKAVTGLVDRAIGGDRRALARLLSRIERDDESGRQLTEELYPRSGRARRIGFTGPPGAGKSSLIARVVAELRALDHRVAVVTVDPTSPFTGGAALGDRIRLMEFHADPNVFIRSMASRGHRGGLAAATIAVAHALDAAGYDPILIETLGVGQDETAVAALVHTVAVLQVPGLGDTVQSLKAGLLEIADILVVNKADRPDADRLARDLATMTSLSIHGRPPSWTPPIVKTSAASGAGVEELVQELDRHHAHLVASGRLSERCRTMAQAELTILLRQQIEDRLTDCSDHGDWAGLLDDVIERRRAPADAVRAMLGGR